ncbi:MAG: YceD family protein [Acidobacteriota bacterium]
MIVDVQQLRERREPLVLEADFSEEQLKLKSDFIALRKPVRANFKVSISDDQLRVSGNLQAELDLSCARCSEAFPYSVQKKLELEYWPDPNVEHEGEEIALSYPDLTIGFYRDEKLDLSAVVAEQIVLEVPMKTVCRPDCKGLCDQCGANLNEVECDCEREVQDPRLTALADLKKKLSQ